MTPKKKLEFSKILVILITVYFFLTLTTAIVYWLVTGFVLPGEFIWAISGPFASVTGFYLVKSGWENYGRNSSCNYNPYYGQGNYNMPTYGSQYNTMPYGQSYGQPYGQTYGRNTPYQYNRPAQY